jgi:[NiFe] hydrogenase assembly HybE family chaperone
MTSAPSCPSAARPSPAAALERRFTDIQRRQMQDMPMLNPALQVRALGFRPWTKHWLGVLVTPWFMNLILFPRITQHWPRIIERDGRYYVFPAGVFEFIGTRDAVLGEYQACSLFSPMFEFATPAEAQDTALAALQALFDASLRSAPDVPAAPCAGETPPPARLRSKRDFLFGTAARGSHEH